MTPGITVADLLETAAARWPDAIAAVAGDESLTYAELHARANRLAHHLSALGVGPDTLVGVCIERSLDMAVGLVAVLKAGGACVPLDPSYPDERLGFMVGDAAVTALVTRSELVARLPDGPPVVRIDEDAAVWADFALTAPPRSIGPEHLGYVIYTSGSTGRPKGTMLTHRGLVNHHLATGALYRLGPGDRVLQFCSIGFDASIEEMFPTWATGATVVFRPNDAPLLGRGWLEWVGSQRITVANLPTAYWHEWARDLDALGEPVPDDIRLVVVGGEKALGPAYRAWARLSGGRSRWINVYGPTETTCMSTFFEPPPGGGDIGEERDPPIGKPLANTTVRVVDDGLDQVPAGTIGELLIGGAGLARGYLNRPELTAERFVTDPAADPPGARAYRTGDLVCELASGDLEFVGRIDDQIKLRGFRIELGEVEAALARHPAVAAAAVIVRQAPPAERELVGYVVAARAQTVGAAELRRFVADHLPSHMVPAAFVVLDAFPLTPNGKVDRAALPAPMPLDTSPGRSRVAPRSPAEERVAAIWARVLGLDPAAVSAEDDFFELGGHSLLATQVIAQLREEFGTETPLRTIFETPTVAGLAAVVEAATATAESTDPAAGPALLPKARQPGEKVPLSLAQEQMWALEMAASPPGLYNVTALHRFEGPVDEGALRDALVYLVGRHETLRTCFGVESGRAWQSVLPTVDVDLGVTDLSDQPADARNGDLNRRIAGTDAEPFDPAQAPLFRAHLFRLDDTSSTLTVTMDHLICDGTAASIFVGELMAAYDALAADGQPELPPLDVQFADFALWQRSHLTDDVVGRQLDWWAHKLEGMPLGPVVAFDRTPETPTPRFAFRSFMVGAATRERLDEVARTTNSTVFVVVTAAVHALFGRYGGTSDVVVSTTMSGRTRAELEGLIGMFSGIGRIRTDLSGDPTFAELVARVRDWVLGMFENQDIPFMRVRRAVLPEFPSGGRELTAVLPVEFQYFHTSNEQWDPATAGGQRTRGNYEQELFFRGQLHPLSVTLLDDGTKISGEFTYKVDFYDPQTIDQLAVGVEAVIEAVITDPAQRLSELPIVARPNPSGR